jgi:hypothetical protein
MILYYALGGGLGHIARSLAILERMPAPLRGQCRLLVSSLSAGIAVPHAPCPVDRVPPAVMENKEDYFAFFTAYLRTHCFTAIVADTFPFGLLGELRGEAGEVPRVLVGRYLRWEPYAARYGAGGRRPDAAVLLEEQEPAYRENLERRGRVMLRPGPVSLAGAFPPSSRRRCCLFHTGDGAELKILAHRAQGVMAELGLSGAPEVIVPENGLFPVERHLAGYSDVVAGAGYGACAMALLGRGTVRFHLTPFPRRYDDQALRLQRLRDGMWGSMAGDATGEAAGAVWGAVQEVMARG